MPKPKISIAKAGRKQSLIFGNNAMPLNDIEGFSLAPIEEGHSNIITVHSTTNEDFTYQDENIIDEFLKMHEEID
jgi:hypothetical protein